EGYKQALAAHRIRLDEALIRECGFFESDGYQAVRVWIGEGSIPPAIFAANDPAAIGAIQALEEAGLNVPGDTAIVGAGNIHYGDRLSVPLTTVTWDKKSMGQQASRLLLSLINSEAPRGSVPTRRVICEPELVVRRSCGARSKTPTAP